jgi:catechol 2,3-dioxygenase-like lactoylglutathione lyase family enzyme
MKAKLATINLQASDPERSSRFYQDVLGLVEDPRRSHPPSFVYLRSDACDVTISAPQEGNGAQPSPTMELGFEVDDMAAMRAHLAALGIRKDRDESMGWGDAVELRDPDGYRVVVYSLRRGD